MAFPILGIESLPEFEFVHVGPGTSVYRRALGEYENHPGAVRVLGIISTVVGVFAVITGLSLIPVGVNHADDDMVVAGGITLGVGALLMALGIWGLNADAPTYRPGAAVHL